MTTALSGSLRVASGLAIVLTVGSVGFFHRSPWIVLPFALAFSILYIQGKYPAWNQLWLTEGFSGLAKSMPITFAIQCVVVSVFYLIGYGLGSLTGVATSAQAFSESDLLVPAVMLVAAFCVGLVIHEIERGGAAHSLSVPLDTSATGALGASEREEAELEMSDEPAREDRFFRARHHSVPNASQIALDRVAGADGQKPKRWPIGASDELLNEAELRLGVRLPDRLKALYRRQNGGIVQTFWVPNKPNPQPLYDDWEDAFAYDYDELKPLSELTTLHALYMEDFDPEYDDEQDKQHWLPGAEKLVILAMRTGSGTALDYNMGDEPGVVIFDLEREGEARIRLSFSSFDAFFDALRTEVSDDPHGGNHEAIVSASAPDPAHPDQFWSVGFGARAASRGVTRATWISEGERLGVMLPESLFPFYEALDGGKTVFVADQGLPRDEDGSAPSPFPEGIYSAVGVLLPSDKWVTLKTLSGRLEFVDNRTPWSQLWTKPDKLIVVAAAFDSALLLDYRHGAEPNVLSVPDLDTPTSAITYSSVSEFLAACG